VLLDENEKILNVENPKADNFLTSRLKTAQEFKLS